MKKTSQHAAALLILFMAFTVTLPTQAQTERFKAADSEGVTATRDKTTLFLKVDANVKGPIKIPRLAAPIRSMTWQGSITDDGIKLKPEPDHWVINWKNRPAQDATLMIRFDDEPLLIDEVKPIKKTSDGSFFLPAHLATTIGEKIRYEPQPYKNTVGFWAGKKDSATWTIQLDKPGRFNVAVLQGCGKGQGGSIANISINTKEPTWGTKAGFSFETLDTGHWQNFKWRHLGEVHLAVSGQWQVTVAPEQIKKAALMDIRAIHLIRLPDKKK